MKKRKKENTYAQGDHVFEIIIRAKICKPLLYWLTMLDCASESIDMTLPDGTRLLCFRGVNIKKRNIW